VTVSLSKQFVIALLLTSGFCCPSLVEAQGFSSRIGSSRRVANGPVARVGSAASQPERPFRLNQNLNWSQPNSFIVQQESQGSATKVEDLDTELDKSEEMDDLEMDDLEVDDFEMDGSEGENSLDLEEDEEDPDELDLDFEEDPRPSRPAFGAWPRKGIRGIGIDIRETNGNVPEDTSYQLLGSNRSDWTQFHPQQKVFAWAAPDIRYQPLYFEDVPLERYGQSAGPYRQSCLSAVHFFKAFVLLPHQMRHDCPGSCDHPGCQEHNRRNDCRFR